MDRSISFRGFSARPFPLLVSGAAAILIVVGAGWMLALPHAAQVERSATGGGPRSYAAAMVRANANLEGATLLEKATPGEWLVEERLANAFMARARLTGSFTDFAAAQAALDRGFATAPKGAGPHQTQLALDFALHRMADAAKMIDAIDHYAVPPEQEMLVETGLTRGDLAFYRGDYDGALRLYNSAGGEPGEAGTLLRIANYLARTGQPDQALALIDQCERGSRLPNAQYLADLAMRRGTIELQRGHWDEASHHFDRAAQLFPGWWLPEALRAQMLALAGKADQAIAAFEQVARVSDSPDAMDALASLYRAGGNRDRSTFWADQARVRWNERLRLFPEASYGHAVEHMLAFGDPAAALDLARRDVANRPYGLTATALAWTLIANNDPAGALAAIKPVLASKWVSAESHLVAAQAYLLLGRSAEAEAEQKAATDINPHATDRTSSLLWFGH